MQKTSRNDPCPCDSGKKYKQCCLAKSTQISSYESDKEWQKLRKIEGKLWEGAFQFAIDEWGPEIIDDGWDAFCLDEDLEQDSADKEHFFPAWVVFRWIPYDYSEEWEDLGPNMTLADLYANKENLVDCAEFLQAASSSPFSFFLIEEVVPARRVVMKDLLVDRVVTIKEKAAACPEFVGKVLFARIVTVKGQAIQIGSGTTPLPIRYSMEILDLKKELLKQEKKLTPELLFQYDNDLRKGYFIWSQSAHSLPNLVNNDGDPIVLCTLYYEFGCSAQAAFDQLIALCKGEDPEEVIEDGMFDENDNLVSIKFPWLKSRSNHLILGEIEIKETSLTIHVNSRERAKKIQSEIKKRLPEACLLNIDDEPIDLNKLDSKNKKSIPYQPTPEERKITKHFLSDYYKKWLDTPVPALNGKTPRQAAKTQDGRERLEILLRDFELGNERKEVHEQIDVDWLRKELNLPSLLALH